LDNWIFKEETMNYPGERNSHWKGDKVGYSGVHKWVYAQKGKALICVDCGSSKNIWWANISGKYKRKLNDWKSLCIPCHSAFDKKTRLTKEQVVEIKSRLTLGEKAYMIAPEYKVSGSTIYDMVNGKTKYYEKDSRKR